MARKRSRRKPSRRRVGRVSYYLHHGAWWVYYRDGDSIVRRRVAESEADAERIAAQLNAQLASATPTLLTFQPIQVGPLCEQFLANHETVLRSSIAGAVGRTADGRPGTLPKPEIKKA